MSHPEREHELQIALATALRERDMWNREAGLLRDALITWQRNAEKTTAERDALRAEVKRLREALERYGRHDRECVAGIVLCACGLDAARQGSEGRQ